MDIQKEQLAHSIYAQLKTKNTQVLASILKALSACNINSYESLKKTVKELKALLKEYEIQIAHTALLDIFAKALGYRSHHALKQSLEIKMYEQILNSKTSALTKFKEIYPKLLKHGIDYTYIGDEINNGHIFYIYFNIPTRAANRYKKFKDILKEAGIVSRGTFVDLFSLGFDEISSAAIEISRYYNDFFYPNYHLERGMLSSIKPAPWIYLSYEHFAIHDGSITVDNDYGSDMPADGIKDFIDFIFKRGTQEDIQRLENVLHKKPISETAAKSYNLLANLQMHSKEKIVFKLNTVQNSLEMREALDKMPNILFAKKITQEYIKNFEIHNKATLHDIIKEIVVNNMDQVGIDYEIVKRAVNEKLVSNGYSFNNSEEQSIIPLILIDEVLRILEAYFFTKTNLS